MMPNIPWSANGKTGLTDSVCPEFMDRFPEGKPILYIAGQRRCREPLSDRPHAVQYDPAWLSPYFDPDENKYNGLPGPQRGDGRCRKLFRSPVDPQHAPAGRTASS